MDDDKDRWIKRIGVTVKPPRLGDNTADMDRLLRGIQRVLPGQTIVPALSVMKRAPAMLREQGYTVEALLYEHAGTWSLFDLLPPGRGKSLYGLAVDLGSSTVVVRVVNLETGDGEGEKSFTNPQTEIGQDILTRILHAGKPGGLGELRRLALESLNREIRRAAEMQGVAPASIAGMAVAGNTTMTHLFLGIDPHWLCREPYIPAANRFPVFKASEIGIGIHPDAPVLIFPNVGSYFGGDLIAGIIASGMAEKEELSILVDVGTNAEIVIGNKDWLVGCAGAAGPALEGGVAGMGMMAGPGVIDKVTIDADSGEVRVRTIGNEAPLGICGSGLIDLASQLYLSGMIDMRGKFVPERCGKRLREIEGSPHFVVVPLEAAATGHDLTLAQTDIDALLRSKAAMYTILTTVTGMVNVSFKDIRNFFVAGTFGSYIDPRSAITLGMVPDLPPETYRPLGNTSLAGATGVLLSRNARAKMDEIRDRMTYIELNVNQEFMNLFSAARFIPHTDAGLFPSVRPRK